MIELYQAEQCPYSKKVRQVLTDLHVSWIAHSAPKGSSNRVKMVELGGKDQIPLLYDSYKNVMLYESEAIITYLNSKYGPVNNK